MVLTVIVYASVLLRFRLFQRYGHVLHLHAAVLVRNERAYLLIGPSGAGKTTITARMVLDGWRYLSDEDALISGGHLYPLPRALRTSAWGIKRLGLQGQTQSYRGFFSDHGERWEAVQSYETRSVPLGGLVVLRPSEQGVARCVAVEPWSSMTQLFEEMHREYLDPQDTSEVAVEVKRYNRQLVSTLEQIMETTPSTGLHYDLDRDLDLIPALLAEWIDS